MEGDNHMNLTSVNNSVSIGNNVTLLWISCSVLTVLLFSILSCCASGCTDDHSLREKAEASRVQYLIEEIVAMAEQNGHISEVLEPVLERKVGVGKFLASIEESGMVPAGTIQSWIGDMRLRERESGAVVMDRMGREYVCVVSSLGHQSNGDGLYGVWYWLDKRQSTPEGRLVRKDCWYFEFTIAK
jgi:hypothetical protein